MGPSRAAAPRCSDLGELPRIHGRCAEVARLSRLHDIVQRLEGLLDRRVRVPAMDLIQVHVVRSEPPQARVDGRENRLARKAAAVRSLAHREIHLRRDHDLVAARVVLERLTDDLLGGAVRISIGGVEEIYPDIDGLPDDRSALTLGQRPRMIAALRNAECHAAETERGDFQTRLPQIFIPHIVA